LRSCSFFPKRSDVRTCEPDIAPWSREARDEPGANEIIAGAHNYDRDGVRFAPSGCGDAGARNHDDIHLEPHEFRSASAKLIG
jgi:hypothetical protein